MPSNYPPLGTISEGTMRSEDLIPAFMSVLREYAPERYEDIALPEEDEDGDYVDPEAASELVDLLFDELGNVAAPYTYFGSHPGDGSDYGFWPDIEALESAASWETEVLKVADGDLWSAHGDDTFHYNGQAIDPAPDYVMSVSDHGNVTLYDAHTRAELWSAV